MEVEFFPQSLFKLGKAYNYGIEASKKMITDITGRACGKPHDYALIAQTVVYAGPGNYVETGTLFGASALVAALTKRKFDIEGMVYCVDPLDGYYGTGNNDMSGILPTPEVLMENAKKYGVEDRIVYVAKKSIPFPKELDGLQFSMAFIDGDHWKDAPTQDWDNLSKATSKYVMFDNYDRTHPSVINAAEKATADKYFRVVHMSSISFILERNPRLSDPHAWAAGT